MLYALQGSTAPPHDDVTRRFLDIVSQHLTTTLVFLEAMKPFAQKDWAVDNPGGWLIQRSTLTALNFSGADMASYPLHHLHRQIGHPLSSAGEADSSSSHSTGLQDLSGEGNLLRLSGSARPARRWSCAGRHALEFIAPFDELVPRLRGVRLAGLASRTTLVNMLSGIDSIASATVLAGGSLFWGTQENDHYSLADEPEVQQAAELFKAPLIAELNLATSGLLQATPAAP